LRLLVRCGELGCLLGLELGDCRAAALGGRALHGSRSQRFVE
jgi:hypothetical protein